MIPVYALTAVRTALAPLAEKIPDPNDVKPGTMAVFVFIFLAVAVVLLLLSFRKQLRKVDGHFGVTGDADEPKKNGSDQRA